MSEDVPLHGKWRPIPGEDRIEGVLIGEPIATLSRQKLETTILCPVVVPSPHIDHHDPTIEIGSRGSKAERFEVGNAESRVSDRSDPRIAHCGNRASLQVGHPQCSEIMPDKCVDIEINQPFNLSLQLPWTKKSTVRDWVNATKRRWQTME
jgi:hypothetical protein